MAKDNRSDLNINEKIGENLRLLRQVVGLSQRDLADILGVSYQQVQKYEAGSCSAARGLRISVTWFENFLPCRLWQEAPHNLPSLAMVTPPWLTNWPLPSTGFPAPASAASDPAQAEVMGAKQTQEPPPHIKALSVSGWRSAPRRPVWRGWPRPACRWSQRHKYENP